MSRKKKKPHDPAAAERHRLEREENAAEVARLRAQPSTAVNVDKRTGRLTGAWSLNCFNTLLAQGSPEREAVDWLDTTLRTANGENGQERLPDFIQASNDGAPGQNITDVMIKASVDLEIVEQNTNPADMRMLFVLLQPDADLITRWRGAVERFTAETDAKAQGARVRAACSHLAWIRDRLPTLRRQYRERRAAAA
jgi:hypothetical protein